MLAACSPAQAAARVENVNCGHLGNRPAPLAVWPLWASRPISPGRRRSRLGCAVPGLAEPAPHPAVLRDPSRHDFVERDCLAKLRPIDVLVNNAGWDVFRPFAKTEPAQWEKLIAVNLVGTLNMHHAVLPGMTARKAGRIVNIAADAARVGSSGEVVYAACRAVSSPSPRPLRASTRGTGSRSTSPAAVIVGRGQLQGERSAVRRIPAPDGPDIRRRRGATRLHRRLHL
jgi:NADP-dependent 3-hydroxy acid dehydrogenase YdfG